MHKLAVAFFYACALLSLSVTALVFISKASAQYGGHVSAYERTPRAAIRSIERASVHRAARRSRGRVTTQLTRSLASAA
ncbi:MAG: hypothetical protein JO012_04375 [Hyphomicrobiales bacterium]|jgi:hypothetical protein|nr:hypothetical protein [Hyphomicrobiales bacterium]